MSGTRIWPQLRDSAAIWDAFEDYFNLSVIPEVRDRVCMNVRAFVYVHM